MTSCLRVLFNMASHGTGPPGTTTTNTTGGTNNPNNTTTTYPTVTYYFAYGSNLHLAQMKRRCPNSRLIGLARLPHHRWQINERGYANVVAAEGRWVDGLVYEIDRADEARLDVNEGVAKGAYAKELMTVMLCRAPAPLYRRPTAWIVDRGGPAEVLRLVAAAGDGDGDGGGGGGGSGEGRPRQWQQCVLVYVSYEYVVDSKPKDEYVRRINSGVADARALGIGYDYISNCIRPFVPPNKKSQNRQNKTTTTGGRGGRNNVSASRPQASGAGAAPARAGANTGVNTGANPATGNKRHSVPAPKRNSTHRPTTHSPARPSSSPSRPPRQADPPQRASASNARRQSTGNTLAVPTERRRANSDVGPTPPPLPPRPPRRMQSIPVIVVEERIAHLSRLG